MPPAAGPPRILAIDAYRGLVMFLMMAEVLHIGNVAKKFSPNEYWQLAAHHTNHVEWTGCSLHDLIQPSFSFLVGVALPFSLTARQGRGQSFPRMLLHALVRAAILIALGVFLRSVGRERTYFTFEDTLTQIGLGYVFLFLLGFAPRLWQWIALAAVLVGYWAAFALYPAPGLDFNYAAVGVRANWSEHFTGFAAHWNKNSNLAWRFDKWFLNLFPRDKPFAYNGGGYATLSFIPTLGTMILGLIAGGLLKERPPLSRLMLQLVGVGAACLAAGYALHSLGVCPSVKRIWTPSWTLFSGGWCFLILAGFYLLTDAPQWSAWSFPLRVIGANSIAIYCLAHLIDGFILKSITTHLGPSIFKTFGSTWEPLVAGGCVLLIFWLILLWMYVKKIFIRI